MNRVWSIERLARGVMFTVVPAAFVMWLLTRMHAFQTVMLVVSGTYGVALTVATVTGAVLVVREKHRIR